MWDIEVQGDMKMVYIFSIVSLLILLIACFNFMSLSTAIAASRSLEVGIRKTIGSTKELLVRQFLGESIITAIIAFLLALGLINIFLPYFNNLTDKDLSMNIFHSTGKAAGINPYCSGNRIPVRNLSRFLLVSCKTDQCA